MDMMDKKGRSEGAKGAKVIDLGEVRARRGLPGPAPKNQISRDECIKLLRSFGQMSDNDIAMLNIPEKVYIIEGPAGALPSISSESDMGAAKIAGSVFMDLTLPPEQPEFAIHFSNRGSSIFCTLVDKKRKIVVSEPISDAQTRRGDWSGFFYTLQDAVSYASDREESGVQFNFVVAKESNLKTA